MPEILQSQKYSVHQHLIETILSWVKSGEIAIHSREALLSNLRMNCIPESIFDMDIEHYDDFLKARRELMAEKIRAYYQSL